MNSGFSLFVNFELESLIVEGKPDPTIPEPAAALVALGLTAVCHRARRRRGFFLPAK